jgi:hypothetical protein
MVFTKRMNTNTTTAQDLTDAQYEVADQIVAWLEAHAGIHSRSVIARGVKASYDDVAAALTFMDSYRMVTADGNKSWRKYGARR